MSSDRSCFRRLRGLAPGPLDGGARDLIAIAQVFALIEPLHIRVEQKDGTADA